MWPSITEPATQVRLFICSINFSFFGYFFVENLISAFTQRARAALWPTLPCPRGRGRPGKPPVPQQLEATCRHRGN